MPLATFIDADAGFYVMLIGRVLQGISLGSCMPGYAAVITQLAPLNERGLFMGVTNRKLCAN